MVSNCQEQLLVVTQEKKRDVNNDEVVENNSSSNNGRISSDDAASIQLKCEPPRDDDVAKKKKKNGADVSNARQTAMQPSYWIVKLCIFLVLPLWVATNKNTFKSSSSPSCNNDICETSSSSSVYVPGVGFSGFWFSLGRLQSLPDPTSHDYYCFSAGCLGSVAVLNGISVEEVACLAQSAQIAWNDGHLSRYDVVRYFVDGLLLVYDRENENDDETNNRCHRKKPELLEFNGDNNTSTSGHYNDEVSIFSKLNILTTTRFMRSSMRKPRDLADLREMLIQTTWM